MDFFTKLANDATFAKEACLSLTHIKEHQTLKRMKFDPYHSAQPLYLETEHRRINDTTATDEQFSMSSESSANNINIWHINGMNS